MVGVLALHKKTPLLAPDNSLVYLVYLRSISIYKKVYQSVKTHIIKLKIEKRLEKDSNKGEERSDKL